jgi:hypothetical protein
MSWLRVTSKSPLRVPTEGGNAMPLLLLLWTNAGGLFMFYI